MQEEDQHPPVNAALIVAAGSGVRAGQKQGRPKQYCFAGGKPILRRTLEAFLFHPEIAAVVVVIRAGDEALYAEAVAGLDTDKLLRPVPGGATRQLSVKAGLDALEAVKPHAVLIHDAARPFISARCISDTISALSCADGAIAAAPVTDTLKRGEDGRSAGTVDRVALWRAQTPQTFIYEKIMAAHRAAGERTDFTDDASIAEWHGLSVALVSNTSENMKITTAEDLAMADMIANGGVALPDVRVGSGFDVHAFEEGDHVTLCGVKIPHDKGLKAHSDGDAGLHALTDALYGTIGAGDIGDHFPPSDPQWRAMDSTVFLKHAVAMVVEKGGRITNADVTLICERPKVGPHRDAMRARMAEILGIEMERVSVKATTSEQLGFTGRREGIAALASATVVFAAR
ncbi:bifunctional 2-C-methyl-D-erythritol 4-phosphate cytidylyltransferase/2-C-methyl-D-erythritol 2,4-cyclodiphosphate synthase [Rhodomicrobium sp. Az07]|uniref:bifunctional 2-C-methyl-D-erythritol 4-phosphate cytidylyltransferase/2-C-methyl-D-erythritol 2,4-cyclodiphosphate synthase n=1 Tax=Rhodomicrobium sp. Az07 TaxID=2839034 RepID=UPI001BE5FDA4|nr:bifunctional 2-C-methyl-D-erythritol 4-phosphate cytidylyltransferase/2-C-methyl-D-erythritol 2,4-cyclodiphosphate synthase [Rhodomicrobium sp. Az07]MBT3071129.1 bifunctional 2-C-methyl-D-erythritol 4-phosphate cytidylyltransferase/2-C-methyl-D-erythritol 2,4-cyclodiphosphate synthase [Rhodomicrobium sp. Az07]